jgi:hypothetical protein
MGYLPLGHGQVAFDVYQAEAAAPMTDAGVADSPLFIKGCPGRQVCAVGEGQVFDEGHVGILDAGPGRRGGNDSDFGVKEAKCPAVRD